jgi:hypothetical protein
MPFLTFSQLLMSEYMSAYMNLQNRIQCLLCNENNRQFMRICVQKRAVHEKKKYCAQCALHLLNVMYFQMKGAFSQCPLLDATLGLYLHRPQGFQLYQTISAFHKDASFQIKLVLL